MKCRLYIFTSSLVLTVLSLIFFASCQKNAETIENTEQIENEIIQSTEEAGEAEATGETGGDLVTKLLYQGHGSFRLTSQDGTVIYVDPYAGEGYDLPAGIILVTHQHGDHNAVNLVTQKDDCTIITNAEALESGKHNSFMIPTDLTDVYSSKLTGINIEAVEASNKNHDSKNCVGYIITIDGIKVYASGDTSKTGQMETFAEKEIDYALLPCDGVYNMDLTEAAECAKLINAKHNIPIHMKPGELFDRERAESFDAPNKLIVEAGEEIVLTKLY